MTSALSDYLASSATVAALLALEGSYSDPPGIADRSSVEGLRGGSVVLMVAAFENYLKESIGEVLNRLNTASPPCQFTKLPIALQAQAVYTGLESAMKAKSWDPVKDRIRRLPGVLVAVRRIHAGELMADAVANTAGNPSSDQVKAIFKLIDYPAVFPNSKSAFDKAWGTPTATTFLEDTLNTIVGRRHVVAHTASILSTSRWDLTEWHRFLNVFVTVLDAILERHISRVIIRAQ